MKAVITAMYDGVDEGCESTVSNGLRKHCNEPQLMAAVAEINMHKLSATWLISNVAYTPEDYCM
jgi:hypothetical protein